MLCLVVLFYFVSPCFCVCAFSCARVCVCLSRVCARFFLCALEKDFYDVREMIGHGTSGEVRRAINRTTGKQVAVKVIETRKFALTPGLTPKELVQEAEMLKRVDHEYIIKLEDIFQVRGEQARGREAQGGRGGPRERRQADRRQLLGTERLYSQGENGKGGRSIF